MGINLADLKKEISKSGTSKGKFLFFRPDSKVRVRFLTDMEGGMEIKFHDSYALGINVPCQEVYGRRCPYCDNEDLRTRNMYVWSVYDYDSKEVKLIMAAVNNCSPVPALASCYETYGTLTDRDYEIKKQGKGADSTFTVVGLDKVKFRNTKVKSFSESAILKYVDKAYPCDDAEEEEEEKPRRNTKSKAASKPKKSEPEETENNDYQNMKARELYNLCDDRGIEAEPRKSKEYYIDLLETADEENNDDDWGDDEESADDGWED